MRLLVVDDDLELRDLLVRALERDGHLVSAVASAASARTALREDTTDLIVLDLALPDGTGIEFCRELRVRRQPVPVLMLTAHSEVQHRVAALDSGADDFLAKPFAIAELRARVRALGRRVGMLVAVPSLELGRVKLDFAARRARRGRTAVALTAREWVILELLAARLGRVVRRAELLDHCWGEATDASAASLEVLVGRIRRKLGEGVVRTVRGEGYALGVT